MTEAPTVRVVMYQPDIPQNTGTILRMAACLDIGVDVIEPCGFVLDDRRLRRAAMDYIDLLDWQRWSSWERYQSASHPGRLCLLTTRGAIPYTRFAFHPDDRLLLGRESAGVPETVHGAADARLVIPMRSGARSLNVAVSAAMVLGEALRQTGGPMAPTAPPGTGTGTGTDATNRPDADGGRLEERSDTAG